ncbi:Hypothetical protein D9617_11g009960 [Elsinoe fawcettii]|nr:Hypothetical protein D9617_11g009960 [Elsinoe fawcettii]
MRSGKNDGGRFPSDQTWVSTPGKDGMLILEPIDQDPERVTFVPSREGRRCSGGGNERFPEETIHHHGATVSSSISEVAGPYEDPRRVLSTCSEVNFTTHDIEPVADTGPDLETFDEPEIRISERNKAGLYRYFVHTFGPRFDLCNPDRTFARTVPMRARRSKTLENALLTLSLRHLLQTQVLDSGGSMQWRNYTFTGLGRDAAVHFHNACIRDLLAPSTTADGVQDEALLAAAVILRSDEEIDAPLQADHAVDSEIFLQVTNVFMENQIPPDADVLNPYQTGLNVDTTQRLRESCFWVAFRQDLHGTYMFQRPINFSLTPFGSFRDLQPAPDPLWAYREIVLAADVAECCYGSRDQPHGRWNDRDLWQHLGQRCNDLEQALPQDCRPFFAEPADLTNGKPFPDLWYHDTWHVTGAAYLLLAKILLTLHDPDLIRPGPGHLARLELMDARLTDLTMTLCGVALNNEHASPTFNNACSAIVLCGEHVRDRRQQKALLEFLAKVERITAWPTQKTAKHLREVWHFG